jgi:predicted aspartyl protease
MTTRFDPAAGPVAVIGRVTGPSATVPVRLALDTGATATQISATILTAIGYDLTRSTRRRRVRAAAGGAVAPVVTISHLVALGHGRTDLAVTALDLPPAVGYHGLLGLDFFRGLVLKLDFARGEVALRPPRAWWQLWR